MKEFELRDPENCVARLKNPLYFESGNTLKKGEMIEVEPVSNSDGYRRAYDNKKGRVFAVHNSEIAIEQEPIVLRLFDETKEGYVYN